MCRSIEEGGRRCPSCGGYAAAARANSNRARNRKVRSLVVAHLKQQGLFDTAAAVQGAAPSMLPELIDKLGIDESAFGGLTLPSTHSHPPSAADILAIAAAERDAMSSPERAALEQARAELEAAKVEQREAKRAYYRARRAAMEATRNGDPHEISLAEAERDKLRALYVAANDRLGEAKTNLLIAEYDYHGTVDEHTRDEYLAELSPADQDIIAAAATAQHLQTAVETLVTNNPIAISDVDRDTSIYTAGTFTAALSNGDDTVEGRLLDGGTAIYRSGYGEFLVLQDPGNGVYVPVATAFSKADAVAKANRVPIFTGLTNPGPDADPLDKQRAEANRAAVLALSKAAAVDGDLSDASARLTAQLDTAAEEFAEALGGARVRNEVHQGASRHRKRLREQAAEDAGAAARAAALAAGASAEDAEVAYRKARRAKLGTPTIGGGVIPLFDHKIPPESLGDEKYASLTRSGIRAFGKETAGDYAVISSRLGNPTAWGFATTSGTVQTSSMTQLTSDFEPYMKEHIDSNQRSALRAYTGHSYRALNAAITGRDKNPSPTTKSTVATLTTTFEQFAEKNTNTTPMTVMRGTRVPSGWKGSADQYLDSAFTVGAKMQMGKVTSATTRAKTAVSFAQSEGTPTHPAYLMVIRTRHGMPVSSLSAHPGEDEVIIPPGSDLRCVHVDKAGINGIPTVYLVAEDIVAEADEGITV